MGLFKSLSESKLGKTYKGAADVGVGFGSAVLGNDGDVIYFRAMISDDYRALGDIGA